MLSFPRYSTNPTTRTERTEKTNHPWQETLEKLEDERYSHHPNEESDNHGHGNGPPSQAPPPVNSLPPRQPVGQTQYSGESARRNRDHYMYTSSENNPSTTYNNNNHNNSSNRDNRSSKRGPRVGIFRASSPAEGSASMMESNLDSLELALQDTSKTSSSTVSTPETHPSHLSISPKRSPKNTPTPRTNGKNPSSTIAESVEAELAYIHNYREEISTHHYHHGHHHHHQYQSNQNRINSYEKPTRQIPRHTLPSALSPNPKNPFASPIPNPYTNPFASPSPNPVTNPFSHPSPNTTNPFEDQGPYKYNHETNINNHHRRRQYSNEVAGSIISAGDPFSQLSYKSQTSSSSSGDNLFRGVESPPPRATRPPRTTTDYFLPDTTARNHHKRRSHHQDGVSLQSSGGSTSNSSNGRGGSGGVSSISSDDPRLNERLGLHLLCAEARSPQDIAWRNALYLLGMQPHLAKEKDGQGRTPLHVACTGFIASPVSSRQPEQQQFPAPPPCFIIQALLIANPGAVQQTDQDGRLPIHCLAASSGDEDASQLLVETHPASITVRDAMGLTPLHLFLLNPKIHVTVRQTQILLGMTLPIPQQQEQKPPGTLRQRRGDHLQLRVEHLDRLLEGPDRVPLWQPMQRYNISEEMMNMYPEDVQVCLRRLGKWERKEYRRHQKEREQGEKADSSKQTQNLGGEGKKGDQDDLHKEAERSDLTGVSFGLEALVETDTNPAAIKSPQDRRLPLHMIVFRGVLDIHLHKMSRSDDLTKTKIRDLGAHQPQTQQHALIVIVRLLISAFPEALISRDINGHTPLLLAMLSASDILPSQELLELLLGKRTAGYESLPTWAQDVPYPIQHVYNYHGLAPAAERYCNPAMVSTLDTCQLPLHIAAEDWGDRPSLLVSIYESYPGAIHVQDARGRMPLHCLLENYRRINPHPQIVALFLSERVAKTYTDEGYLPFDLLVACSSCLPMDPIRCNEPILPNGTLAHPDACRAFQKFFQISILASSSAARSTRVVRTGPEANAFRRRVHANAFLWQLRALPPWLRRQACSAPFVQELLLDELSRPAKCAFVMIYGLLLSLLLATFHRQMRLYIETASPSAVLVSRSNASANVAFFDGTGEAVLGSAFTEALERYEAWNALAIYGFSAGSIGFQTVFVALSCSLNEFQHLCLFNIWRWIDFLAVVASVMTSAMIHASFPDEQVFVLGTAATGLLWCSVVGYLSNWWYGAAFFTGALLKIARMIAWPVLVAAIFLVGFAEMFYTLSQVDCSKNFSSSPVCSLRDAFQMIYFIWLGEPIFEIGGTETLSPGLAILLALLSMLVFLMILCVLVVAVVVASKHEAESVALDAYWEPKLAFVLASQDARAAASVHKKGLSTRLPTRVDRLVAKLAEIWDVATYLIYGNKKGSHWYVISNSPWKNGCLRVLAVILIPLWILAGFATLGFLWPPQVRHFIFSPKASEDWKPNEAREFFSSQVASVQNEIMKMKDMSYEQSNDIHRDIQSLRQEIQQMVMAIKK